MISCIGKVVLQTKKKIIAGLAVGIVVIAGAAAGIKAQGMLPAGRSTPSSSPTVQMEENNITPVQMEDGNRSPAEGAEDRADPNAEGRVDPNGQTAEEAEAFKENQGSQGQAEGVDLRDETEAPAGEGAPDKEAAEPPVGDESEELIWGLTEASVLYTSPQPGDKYLREDGSIGVIADWDEADEICLKYLTPEELQQLRDLNLTFN